MITAELSIAQRIGKGGASIPLMTQKYSGDVSTFPAEYECGPRLLSIRVMLQFGDKAWASAKKFLAEDERSKTTGCGRAFRFLPRERLGIGLAPASRPSWRQSQRVGKNAAGPWRLERSDERAPWSSPAPHGETEMQFTL